MTIRSLRRHLSAAGALGLALAGVTLGSSPPASAAAAPAASTAVPILQVCGHGAAVERPSSMIVTCADGLEKGVQLAWTRWTPTGATATGLTSWPECVSACTGPAKSKTIPARFTLSAPVVEPGGTIAFTRLHVRLTGAIPSGFLRDIDLDETPQPTAQTSTSPHPQAHPQAGHVTAGRATQSPQSTTAASGTLGYAQIEGFWVDAGGSTGTAETAAAITGAESSFYPGNIQPGVDYCDSTEAGWGLWQITCGNSEPAYGTDFQLLDPWNNAEAAVAKYNGSVAAGNNGFYPWVTYNDGSYSHFMQPNVAPDTNLTDPGEYVQYHSTPPGTPSSPGPNPGSTYGPPLNKGPGEFHVFGASSAGNLFQDWYGTGWSGYAVMGAGNGGEALLAQPAVAYDPDNGTYHVFAVGRTSGNVYQVTFVPGTGWTDWQNLGGTLQGGLSAVYENGTFEVFGTSPGGNLFEDWFGSSGWSGWGEVTGGNDGEALAGGPAVAYDPGNGTFHAFAVGKNTGNTYQVTFVPGTGWTDWQNLGGAVKPGLSAVYENGTFEVFAVSTSGKLFEDWYGTGWSGWGEITGGNDGEVLGGGPAAVYDTSNGTFHVFTVGASSGSTYQVTWTSGTGWTDWQNLGGALQNGGLSAAYVPSA
ncbi:hypothetical protein ABH935_001420 [Catenulispora sp. GAS73]|uniref:hypothetical protein n=1 Tax=Catenulispora sp. GAS73 TaxID=3156269 RepID=UPI0035163BA0